jgi:small subunit ribosomal protein S14
MAKTSVKARQKKRERMVAQYAEKRKELKKAGGSKGKRPRMGLFVWPTSSPTRMSALAEGGGVSV